MTVTGRYGWATIRGQLVNMRDGGFISAHDYKLGDMIAEIVSGGDIDQGRSRCRRDGNSHGGSSS